MKNLPPLEARQAYLAQDFERFEFFGWKITGKPPSILRLHLKNATTIDIPTTDDNLKQLMSMLINAFGRDAIDLLKAMKWIP